MRFIVIALIAVYATLVAGQQTGLKSTISANGLSYIKDVGLQVLHQQLQSLSISDINGDTGMIFLSFSRIFPHFLTGTPIGSISYSLTQIHLTGLSIPSASIQLVPGQGVNVGVYGSELTRLVLMTCGGL